MIPPQPEPNYRAARRTNAARFVLCPACHGAERGCPHCNFWGTVLRGSPDDRCIHAWTSRVIAHCLHERTCTKCGTTDEVDTSG